MGSISWLLLAALLDIFISIRLVPRLGAGRAVLCFAAVSILGFLVIRCRGFLGRTRGLSPLSAWIDRVLIVVAGLLFIFPGPLTDLCAVALLLPPLRAGVRGMIGRRVSAGVGGQVPSPAQRDAGDPSTPHPAGKSRRPFVGAEKARDVEFHEIPRSSGQEGTSGSRTVPEQGGSG